MPDSNFDNPLSPANVIREFRLLKDKVITKTQNLLNERGIKSRSGDDDNIFTQFNTVLAILMSSGHQFGTIGVEIFKELEEVVLNFEKSEGTVVHKGSIYFNVGLLFLWSGDFDRALYYWIAAENEDKKLGRHATTNIFHSDLFNKNFGTTIRNFVDYEVGIESNVYHLLTGNNFNYSDFENYLKTIGHHSLVNLIINFYRSIIYSGFNKNESTDLLYYRLVNDYCLMFETAIKEYLLQKSITPQQMLGNILRNNLHTTVIGDITSSFRSNVEGRYRCSSVSDYNYHLPRLLSDIRSETSNLLLAAKLLHLITITRNQVAHDFNIFNTIYGDIENCKTIIRLIIISMSFNKYI